MDIVLTLLAVVGTSFIMQKSSGPFDILDKIRNFIARIPVIGVLFFNMLSCDFCVGLWSGLVIYMIVNSWYYFNLHEMIVFVLSGGAFNLLFWKITNKLL